MRGAVLFSAMGALCLVLAAVGALTGTIPSLLHRGPEWIARADHPLAFHITLAAAVAFAVLFLALAGFQWWSTRQAQSAEERYFRQRDLLAPKKD